MSQIRETISPGLIDCTPISAPSRPTSRRTPEVRNCRGEPSLSAPNRGNISQARGLKCGSERPAPKPLGRLFPPGCGRFLSVNESYLPPPALGALGLDDPRADAGRAPAGIGEERPPLLGTAFSA